MLVREVFTNADGTTGERWIEMPGVLPQAEGDAVAAGEAQKETNGLTLAQQAEQALVDLRAYRDRTNPTTTQTTAAVKLLCRVAIGLIRLHLRKLDATD